MILDVSNSYPQEHEISYKREIDNNAPELLCVQDLVFLRIFNWKHLGLTNEYTAKTRSCNKSVDILQQHVITNQCQDALAFFASLLQTCFIFLTYPPFKLNAFD